MFFLSGKINEKPLAIAIFDIQRVGEGETLVHFDFILSCPVWIFKPHLCVISLSKIR